MRPAPSSSRTADPGRVRARRRPVSRTSPRACSGSRCSGSHPPVGPLVAGHLPAPRPGRGSVARRDHRRTARHRVEVGAHTDRWRNRWVLQRAVAALATPRASAAGLRLEVNVSARSLEDPELGDWGPHPRWPLRGSTRTDSAWRSPRRPRSPVWTPRASWPPGSPPPAAGLPSTTSGPVRFVLLPQAPAVHRYQDRGGVRPAPRHRPRGPGPGRRRRRCRAQPGDDDRGRAGGPGGPGGAAAHVRGGRRAGLLLRPPRPLWEVLGGL